MSISPVDTPPPSPQKGVKHPRARDEIPPVTKVRLVFERSVSPPPSVWDPRDCSSLYDDEVVKEEDSEISSDDSDVEEGTVDPYLILQFEALSLEPQITPRKPRLRAKSFPEIVMMPLSLSDLRAKASVEQRVSARGLSILAVGQSMTTSPLKRKSIKPILD